MIRRRLGVDKFSEAMMSYMQGATFFRMVGHSLFEVMGVPYIERPITTFDYVNGVLHG